MENYCKNGKCDLRNQTSDEILNHMTFNDGVESMGYCFFLFKDENEERGHRKDIYIDLSYKTSNMMADDLGDDIVSFKFIPYGFYEDLDEVVKDMEDGPFNAQLKK